VSPDRSYVVCATPRSGSTLVCQALKETGVAGRPEEYFEALEHSGRPRRPEEYFNGVEDPSILNQLQRRGIADEPQPRSPLWSRTAYDRYLEWAMEQGTTPNGVFGAKLMWGYLGDFVSLLRNVPEYRDLPLAELLPTVFPDLTFVRVVRANKVRQAISLWKAVQTATWRQEGEKDPFAGVPEDSDVPPYKTFLDEHLPALRFNFNAISHLLGQILRDEARWDAFFEYETSTLNVLNRLGLAPPDGFKFEPRMKSQSDGLNDDWARRYSELRLGTEFDLVPSVPDAVHPPAA
jgi:LPS sulfotransferase NodH